MTVPHHIYLGAIVCSSCEWVVMTLYWLPLDVAVKGIVSNILKAFIPGTTREARSPYNLALNPVFSLCVRGDAHDHT